jgi:hypothetical protein
VRQRDVFRTALFITRRNQNVAGDPVGRRRANPAVWGLTSNRKLVNLHGWRAGRRSILPVEVLEYFRKQGAKGGRIGGKRSLETMTPQERSERARKAVAARETKREKA